DVERPRAVSAGADDVDERRARRADGEDVLTHGLREAGDLVDCLAFRAKTDQQTADLGGSGLAAHHDAHHLARLVAREAAPVGDGCDRGDDHERKFSAICAPSGVRTLSGWNCTPSTGCSTCRTPITSPSAVRAVTCSASGTVVAASEW